MYLYRLQLGQMEVMRRTKFRLYAGVLTKTSLNSVYVKEEIFWDATKKSFLQEHRHHLPTSLIIVDMFLMLSL